MTGTAMTGTAGTTVTPGTIGTLRMTATAASGLGRRTAVNMMIVAPGLRLRPGGIMMRENLQGTMITGGVVMMTTAECLIIMMTVVGRTVNAAARKRTTASMIGLLLGPTVKERGVKRT